MKAKSNVIDLSLDFRSGKQKLLLEVEGDWTEFYEKNKDKPLALELKQYRKSRSLDSNAYFHVLIGKIASAIGQSNTYTKNRLIADYGEYERIDGEVVTLPLADHIDSYKIESLHLQPTTEMHFNSKGKAFRIHMVMRGSHTYDTKEMARLIDGTVEEAKALGIETEPPERLREMAERWGVKFEKRTTRE